MIIPEGFEFSYTLKFGFITSNNKAEYKATLVGLQLAKALGIQHITLKSDSQLVTNWINEEFQVKEETRMKYFQRVNNMKESFRHIKVEQIPSKQNG